jgi:uncharacterized membrane-anchored protein
MKSAPIDPVIADLLDRLTTQLLEEFSQRVEQLEFKADYPHRLQSCIDQVEALRRNLANQIHITCLRVELDGSTEFVLTVDLEYARKHLADIRVDVIAEEPIEEVIERQYGGVAALTFLG